MFPSFIARGATFFARGQATWRQIASFQQDIKHSIPGNSMRYAISLDSAGSVQKKQSSSMCSSSVTRDSLRPSDHVSAVSDTECSLQPKTVASTFTSSMSSESDPLKRAYLKQLEDKLVAAIEAYKVESTIKLLSQLRQYDGPLESSSLKLVMKACVGKLWQVAEEVIEILKSKGVKPDREMNKLLLQSLCLGCQIHKALIVLEEMADSLEPGQSKTFCMSMSATNAVLDAAVSSNSVWWSNKVLQFLSKHGLKPNKWTQVLMLKAVGGHQDRRKVRAKWAELSAKFGKEGKPVHLNSAFVATLANVGAVWEARLALEEMRSSWEGDETRGNLSKYKKMKRERDWICTMAGDVKRGYDGVLSAAAAEGNTSLVKQLLHEVKESVRGYSFYNLTEEYNLQLAAAANAGDLDEFSALAQLMQQADIHVWPRSYIAWVRALCKQGCVMDALDVVRRLATKRYTFGKDVFHTIALASLRTGNLQNMKATVRLMKESMTADHVMAATLYTAAGMEMSTQGADISRCLDDIASVPDSAWTSSASFHARIWALGQGGQVDLTMLDMRWARKRQDRDRWPLLNVLIYNTAIQTCCRHWKLEEMVELMEMMRGDDGCFRDVATDNSLRNEAIYNGADLRSALSVISALRRMGKSPDHFIFRFFIEVASHAGNLDDSVKLLDIMEKEGIEPDIDTMRTIVVYAAQHGRLDVMEKMVGRMRVVGFVVDADMCLAIVPAYVKAGRHTHALTVVEMVQSQMVSGEGSSSDLESSAGGPDNGDGSGVPFVLNFERLRELIERDRVGGGWRTVRQRVGSSVVSDAA